MRHTGDCGFIHAAFGGVCAFKNESKHVETNPRRSFFCPFRLGLRPPVCVYSTHPFVDPCRFMCVLCDWVDELRCLFALMR